MQEDLVKQQKAELMIPEIKAEDMVALLDLGDCIGNYEFRKGFQSQYEVSSKKFVTNAIKQVEVKRWLKRTRKYDCLNEKFFNSCSNFYSELHQKVFPQEINEIGNLKTKYSSEKEGRIGKIHGCLENLVKENNLFLKYFFLTPINESVWEKHMREIIPVTESSENDFLMFRHKETKVKPFEKTTYEIGYSKSENMQIIPCLLEEEDLGFYIGKILEFATQYNAEVKGLVQTLSKLTNKSTFESEHPEMEHFKKDVKIMNYCLKHLLPPYSPATGFYVIQLNTAVSRIKTKLGEITSKLEKDRDEFCEGFGYGIKPFNPGRIANLLGFKVVYTKTNYGYGVGGEPRPKCALREIKKGGK